MAANTQPIFPVAPKFGSVAIANADAQNVKTLYTAGANGARISKLILLSTDTVAKDVGIWIGAVLIGTVNVAIGAGQTGTVPAKDVFNDTTNFKHCYFDANGNLVLDLPAAVVLGINAPVSVTAAKAITGCVTAGDF